MFYTTKGSPVSLLFLTTTQIGRPSLRQSEPFFHLARPSNEVNYFLGTLSDPQTWGNNS